MTTSTKKSSAKILDVDPISVKLASGPQPKAPTRFRPTKSTFLCLILASVRAYS